MTVECLDSRLEGASKVVCQQLDANNDGFRTHKVLSKLVRLLTVCVVVQLCVLRMSVQSSPQPPRPPQLRPQGSPSPVRPLGEILRDSSWGDDHEDAHEKEATHVLSMQEAIRTSGSPINAPWERALEQLRRSASGSRWVIVNCKNGLGNRLRALASAMAVAQSLERRLLIIWVPDLHCNCSFDTLLPTSAFPVISEDIPTPSLTNDEFQVVNYMRPEPGAVKDAAVVVDQNRHLYFKSAFLMNHPQGGWAFARHQIQKLVSANPVQNMLVTNRSLVGLHVRNVFDAPRGTNTTRVTTGDAAIHGAASEYGVDGAAELLAWRRAAHWKSFVPRIEAVTSKMSRSTRFYLSADTLEAYEGASHLTRFPFHSPLALPTGYQCVLLPCHPLLRAGTFAR